MTGTTAPGSAPPAVPVTLSMFDPVYIGIDEFGHPVSIRVIYKNLLSAGEPGGGKSALLQNLVCHAALSARSRLRATHGPRALPKSTSPAGVLISSRGITRVPSPSSMLRAAWRRMARAAGNSISRLAPCARAWSCRILARSACAARLPEPARAFSLPIST